MVSLHGDGVGIRPLDSSELLIGENCRVRVREVALMRSQASFDTLEEALSYADRIGYAPKQMSIVNVVHGESKKNEPRPVLTLAERDAEPIMEHVGDGIIAENPYDNGGNGRYNFYKFGEGFSYIA